jgi:SAM-dependent methyltransferase
MHFSLLRSTECKLYQDVPMDRPTLDIGCGDGFFASACFESPLEVGVDPSTRYMKEAKESRAYRYLIRASGTSLPFPEGHFGSVVSNSVLEHIPDLDGTLKEIHRVLQESAYFVFTVPAGDYTDYLLGTHIFRSLHLHAFEKLYSRYFDFISRHIHSLSHDGWIQKLETIGFEVVDSRDYFSREAMRIFDLAHWLVYPAFIVKKLTNRWVLFPSMSAHLPFHGWLQPYGRIEENGEGAYFYFLCRKRRGGGT